MSRALWGIFILCLVIFIFQQSHVVQKVKVRDVVLGVDREEYQFHWENIGKYQRKIFKKSGRFFERLRYNIKSQPSQ